MADGLEDIQETGEGARERLLYATVRLETERADGALLAATAFVFQYRAEEAAYPFLVTARHAVAGASEGRLTFIPERRGRPDLSKGYILDIENFAKLWHAHPDEALDLAVTPFAPFVRHIEDSGTPLFYRALEAADTGPLPLLSPLVLAVHAQGLSGEGAPLPVLVSGAVAATHPRSGEGQDRFLAGVPLFPGASGAPVMRRQGDGDWSLAGMLTSAYRTGPLPEDCALVSVPEAFAVAGAAPALGAAVHARAILALVHGYLKEKGFV